MGGLAPCAGPMAPALLIWASAGRRRRFRGGPIRARTRRPERPESANNRPPETHDVSFTAVALNAPEKDECNCSGNALEKDERHCMKTHVDGGRMRVFRSDELARWVQAPIGVFTIPSQASWHNVFEFDLCDCVR